MDKLDRQLPRKRTDAANTRAEGSAINSLGRRRLVLPAGVAAASATACGRAHPTLVVGDRRC